MPAHQVSDKEFGGPLGSRWVGPTAEVECCDDPFLETNQGCIQYSKITNIQGFSHLLITAGLLPTLWILQTRFKKIFYHLFHPIEASQFCFLFLILLFPPPHRCGIIEQYLQAISPFSASRFPPSNSVRVPSCYHFHIFVPVYNSVLLDHFTVIHFFCSIIRAIYTLFVLPYQRPSFL